MRGEFFSTPHRSEYYRFKGSYIAFKKPATTDITVEASMPSAQAEQIKKITDETGKADWDLDLELKDTKGEVCCIAHGIFQMRKIQGA